MDVATRRLPFAPLPWRVLGIVILLLIVAAGLVVVGVGSSQRVPAPFGEARNGQLAYTVGDAIYTRDSIVAPERLLFGGDGTKHGFWGFSPDGTKMLFQRQVETRDYLFVADADGRNERQILEPFLLDALVAWAPDSRRVAVTLHVGDRRRLLIVPTDGKAPTEPTFGRAWPRSSRATSAGAPRTARSCSFEPRARVSVRRSTSSARMGGSFARFRSRARSGSGRTGMSAGRNGRRAAT